MRIGKMASFLLVCILSCTITGCQPRAKLYLLNETQIAITVATSKGNITIDPGERRHFIPAAPLAIYWGTEKYLYSMPEVPTDYISTGLKGFKAFLVVDSSRRLFLQEKTDKGIRLIEPQPENFPVLGKLGNERHSNLNRRISVENSDVNPQRLTVNVQHEALD